MVGNGLNSKVAGRGDRLPWTGLGLAALTGVAAGATAAVPAVAAQGLSALALALLWGMLLAHVLPSAWLQRGATGLGVARHQLLRWGVVLYGLNLTFQNVAQVGVAGVLIDLLMLTLTFVGGRWIGMRWLGLDRETASLVSAGSAICGAAAVLATAPVVRARDSQASVAVACVVLFGSLGMFLYPWLHAHSTLVAGDPGSFGVYIGSTLHEVAQVVVAAHAIDPATQASAVITKMVRVMLLAPFLVALALRQPASSVPAGLKGPAWHRRVPWFAFGFALVVAWRSWVPMPATWVRALMQVDLIMLTMAMAALGLTTHVRDLRGAGLRPLLLGAALFVWLILGGAVVNRLVRLALGSWT